ncbi:MAG: efflux RND transporter periplasmic adaptor subunit [Phycisphaeraceae bacterium]|nr:efflux RND transporter periplasmic adaptor subunit [Phycisphaeraceae bacterium]
MFRRPAPTRFASALPITLCITMLTLAIAGCDRTTADPPPRPPIKADAITAASRDVPDVRRYPGTTEAVRQVMIVARVTGYLDARHFKEGSMVEAGAPLFTIEQAPYEAAVRSARGRLEDAVARATYARLEFERNEPLGVSGAISASAWDEIVAATAEAEGQLATAAGDLEVARINLSYTTITAPFAGRIGRRFVDVGNLVGPGSNEDLAELVTVHPMRIVFDPPARDAAAFLAAWTRGVVPVTVTVDRGDADPASLNGEIDLVNNVVDDSTSTFLTRAEFPNPTGELLPGTYAPVDVRLGILRDRVVVPDAAIFKDTQYAFVWTVEDGKARRENVTVGVLWNGLRVVEGIDAGTVVVIAGDSIRLKEGAEVRASVDTLSSWESGRSGRPVDTPSGASS